jgi:hypothetical protein
VAKQAAGAKATASYQVVPVAECEAIHPSNRTGHLAAGYVCEQFPDLAKSPTWQYTGSPTFDTIPEAQTWIDTWYTRSAVTHQARLF